MYVCGMTVQAPPHVGHMRAYVVADLMRRVFRARGYTATLVQNFTDIDDKIIARAAEEGISWKELAERNIEQYFRAADWVGIERADHYPRATEHIPEILSMIEGLVSKGYAYASGGDVFFAVTQKKDYGKLSGKKIDELRSGVRVEIDEDKRHPVDFALWKGAKPGEPFWESPWGKGRPGWHIECSAMAMKYLGHTLDLHGGGRDLIFPHHENELAQSEAATGRAFCNHWVENGMVNLAGEKMSKSTGVFFLVEDLRKEVEPVALRLYLLSTHYRSPIEYGKERLDEAASALERIRNFLAGARHASGTTARADARPTSSAMTLEGEDAKFRDAMEKATREFHGALDDDFNSAGAIGKLFEIVRAGNAFLNEGVASSHYGRLLSETSSRIEDLAGLLGLGVGPSAWPSEEEVPSEVMELVQRREEARREKNWRAADELRERIRQSGYVVEDRADGPLVKSI
jgi:cysteinyl-tRNA synthetase